MCLYGRRISIINSFHLYINNFLSQDSMADRQQKQKHLRDNILEDQYEDFFEFCQTQMSEIDIDKWSYEEVIKLVTKFRAQKNKQQKEQVHERSFANYQTANMQQAYGILTAINNSVNPEPQRPNQQSATDLLDSVFQSQSNKNESHLNSPPQVQSNSQQVANQNQYNSIKVSPFEKGNIWATTTNVQAQRKTAEFDNFWQFPTTNSKTNKATQFKTQSPFNNQKIDFQGNSKQSVTFNVQQFKKSQQPVPTYQELTKKLNMTKKSTPYTVESIQLPSNMKKQEQEVDVKKYTSGSKHSTTSNNKQIKLISQKTLTQQEISAMSTNKNLATNNKNMNTGNSLYSNNNNPNSPSKTNGGTNNHVNTQNNTKTLNNTKNPLNTNNINTSNLNTPNNFNIYTSNNKQFMTNQAYTYKNSKIPYQGQTVHKTQFKDTVKCFEAAIRSQLTDKNLEIVIQKHQIVERNIFVKDYVMYYLTVKPLNVVCKRNYEDFTRLRSSLEKFYPGFQLPYLQKNSFFETSAENIKRQKNMLEFFLNDLVRIPQIKNSRVFEDFLTLKEHKAIKRKFEEYSKMDKLKGIQELCVVGGKINVIISQNQRIYHENLQTLLDKMSEVISKKARLMQVLASQFTQINQTLTNLSKLSAELSESVKKFNQKVNDDEIPSLQSTLNIISKSFQQWANRINFESRVVNKRLAPFYQYQKNNIDTLRDLLDKQGVLYKSYIKKLPSETSGTAYQSDSLKDAKTGVIEESRNPIVLKYQFGYMSNMVCKQAVRFFQLMADNFKKKWIYQAEKYNERLAKDMQFYTSISTMVK